MSILGTFIVPHPPIILPQVGRGEEKRIQKTIDGYQLVAEKIQVLQPETVVITSPHSAFYSDYFHISPEAHASGDLQQFGIHTVHLTAEYDRQFARLLEKEAASVEIQAGKLGKNNPGLDHGTLIPLWFLQQKYTAFRLVRIGLSGESLLTHYQFGKCIAETAERLNRSTVLIASGDLSHRLKADGPYGFAPEGPEFDRKITTAMASGDFLEFLNLDPELCERAGECGLRSFVIMAGALDGKSVRSELLSYEGPFGVGYAVAAFEPAGADETRHFDQQYEQAQREKLARLKAQEDPYVKLARASLEHYLTHRAFLQLPDGLPQEMLTRQAGVFVSLKKHDQLRGCIGTIFPGTANIAEEIIMNAVSSGTNDPRFPPVSREELADLVYSVDVLSPPEPIPSAEMLDMKRYGVIVSRDYRRGLLLPNLEGVDTVEEQITIALRKAGIREDEPYELERFEVVRHQ